MNHLKCSQVDIICHMHFVKNIDFRLMGRGNKSSDQCLKLSICLNIGVNHLNCLECSQVDIIFQMHFIVNILNNVVIEI